MNEIERKFLIQTPPEDFFHWPHQRILQGYLIVTDDEEEIRIRKKGDIYFQTLKSGKGLSRFEIEIEITKNQFETLWPVTQGRQIQKTRYTQTINHHIIELDVFEKPLQGLMIAEVEFDSIEASQKFEPLNWFDKEITTDDRYKNRNLAQ